MEGSIELKVWKEVTIEINQEAAEAVSNIMTELGSGGVLMDNQNNRQRLTAYYYNDEGFSDILEELKERINKLKDYKLDSGEVIYEIGETHQEDWANNWQQYFKPLEVGNKFIITPSWETETITADDRFIIEIDPGMAFGIGSHETTRMCLELMEEYIDSGYRQGNMLDIGTGTGILSIAAAYLGVDDITGVDIDHEAVSAARENIRINQVEEKVKILKGDMTRDIRGKYSIITANLLPDLIMRLLPAVPALMDDKSLLILSGIIKEKRAKILSQMRKLGLKLLTERQLNDWLSFVVVKEN